MGTIAQGIEVRSWMRSEQRERWAERRRKLAENTSLLTLASVTVLPLVVAAMLVINWGGLSFMLDTFPAPGKEVANFFIYAYVASAVVGTAFFCSLMVRSISSRDTWVTRMGVGACAASIGVAVLGCLVLSHTASWYSMPDSWFTRPDGTVVRSALDGSLAPIISMLTASAFLHVIGVGRALMGSAEQRRLAPVGPPRDASRRLVLVPRGGLVQEPGAPVRPDKPPLNMSFAEWRARRDGRLAARATTNTHTNQAAVQLQGKITAILTDEVAEPAPENASA